MGNGIGYPNMCLEKYPAKCKRQLFCASCIAMVLCYISLKFTDTIIFLAQIMQIIMFRLRKSTINIDNILTWWTIYGLVDLTNMTRYLYQKFVFSDSRELENRLYWNPYLVFSCHEEQVLLSFPTDISYSVFCGRSMAELAK